MQIGCTLIVNHSAHNLELMVCSISNYADRLHTCSELPNNLNLPISVCLTMSFIRPLFCPYNTLSVNMLGVNIQISSLKTS